MNKIFRANRLGAPDFILMTAFVLSCFIFFYHPDIWGVGWDSLNYLFGHPLEFYENCKRIRGNGQHMFGTPYPPSIYIIFALWLYPFKLFGAIDSPISLPYHFTYWLKLLTTLVYSGSAFVFFKIASIYFFSKEQAKYATAAWLVMPLALFSQLIFSQYDIFYVALSLVGFLFFIRNKVVMASFFFGVAITFKYFPAFAFVPLLLLFEKKIVKLFLCLTIFYFPTFLVGILYGQSAAYIEGVSGHVAIDRVYSAFLEIDSWRIYFLFATFMILCGIAYFYDVTKTTQAKVAAYFWLVSSILPFLFIFWHPQWVMFFAPPIVLTSIINRHANRFFILDLIGMLFFVAVISLTFTNNVDAGMFRGEDVLPGMIFFDNSYLMGKLFEKFGPHSANVFLSGFWAYLVLQIIIKHKSLFTGDSFSVEIDYGNIRRSMYIGLLIFLLPAIYAIYKDLKSGESSIKIEMTGRVNGAIEPFESTGKVYGELLKERTFEQSFLARGDSIKNISLFLATFARENHGKFLIELIDSSGVVIMKLERATDEIKDNAWLEVPIGNLKVIPGNSYKIRLTSPTGSPENAISWWASSNDIYLKGEAIVDGVPQKSDFAFRVFFTR